MFTKKELAECAHRELSYRQRLYPRWVTTGKIKQTEADLEIAKMTAIYRTIMALPDDHIKTAQQP